jgi:hypothetical protein
LCVDALEGDVLETEAGGAVVMTQRESALMAFDVLGKPGKITVIPMWLARFLVKFVRYLCSQLGDLAKFIVAAGEIADVASTDLNRNANAAVEIN